MTNIYHCQRCKWIGKATQQPEDDRMELMCPRCPNEYAIEMTEMEVSKAQCKTNCLQDIINWHIIETEWHPYQERRAQIGSYDFTENQRTDVSIFSLINKNGAN